MPFTAINKSGTKKVREAAAPKKEACLGLSVCMVGSLMFSSSKNRSDDSSDDSEAQRENRGFQFRPVIDREPKKASRTTFGAKNKKEAFAAAGSTSDSEDEDFFQVVHCEFPDDKSTTDGGELLTSDSDGDDSTPTAQRAGYLSSSFVDSSSDDDDYDEVVTLDGHTDTEDEEGDAAFELEDDELVDVANWSEVGSGMAGVFKGLKEKQYEEKHDEEEIIDVRSWREVGSRLAAVFAEEIQAEDEWEAPAKAAGIRAPPGLEAPWRA